MTPLTRCSTEPIISFRRSNSSSPSNGSPEWRPATSNLAFPPFLQQQQPQRSSKSRALLAATPFLFIAIYFLAFVCIPFIVTSNIRQPSDSFSSSSSSSSSTHADLNGLHPSPHSFLKKTNRRMALQQQHQQHSFFNDDDNSFEHSPINADLISVEYKYAGNYVSLSKALNPHLWDEQPVYTPPPSSTTTTTTSRQLVQPPHHDDDISSDGTKDIINNKNNNNIQSNASSCPTGDIRLLIAITTRCCNAKAQAKREAIRSTWVKEALSEHADEIDIKFFLSQPADPSMSLVAHKLLPNEVATSYSNDDDQGDMVIVPGKEAYRLLPEKTLRLMHYGLSSPCNYTHILKTDDDVYLRPSALLDIIKSKGGEGGYEYEFDIAATATSATVFDGKKMNSTTSITTDNNNNNNYWMQGMYVGQVDSNKTGVFPGWTPTRDNKNNKWYLSEEDLPDSDLDGVAHVRWLSGWGYLMSRDVIEAVVHQADEYQQLAMIYNTSNSDSSNSNGEEGAPSSSSFSPSPSLPPWWGRMPWEDILVATLLKDYSSQHGSSSNDDSALAAKAYHHRGFKAAWEECDPGTVLKHLDMDAPSLLQGLYDQDASGLWDKMSVVCSSGDFRVGEYDEWRAWRNAQVDITAGKEY